MAIAISDPGTTELAALTIPTNANLLRVAIAMCAALTTLLLASYASSRTIALTFDDGPDMEDTIGLSPADRNAAVSRDIKSATTRRVTRTSMR